MKMFATLINLTLTTNVINFEYVFRTVFSWNNCSRLLLYFYHFKIRKVFNLGLCLEQAFHNKKSSIVSPPGASAKALVSGELFKFR